MKPWKFFIYGFVVLGVASLINVGLAFDDDNTRGTRGSSSGTRSWSSGSSSSGWSFGGGHK